MGDGWHILRRSGGMQPADVCTLKSSLHVALKADADDPNVFESWARGMRRACDSAFGCGDDAFE